MTCSKCGRPVSVNATFCTECGERTSPSTNSRMTTSGGNPPGSIYLMVTGIIYIVFGAIGVVSALTMGVAGAALGSAFGLGGLLGGLAFLAMIPAAFSIVVGILGVMHRGNLEKAGMLMILGIVAVALDLLTAMLFQTFSIFTLIALAIPGCYAYGAYLNKNTY